MFPPSQCRDCELIGALQALVDELHDYDVPQTDDEGLFSEKTALGFANKLLAEALLAINKAKQEKRLFKQGG